LSQGRPGGLAKQTGPPGFPSLQIESQTALVKQAVQDHHCFLPLGKDRLEVLLSSRQVFLGLCASLTQGVELALDVVSRGILILQSRSQILQSLLGCREGLAVCTTATATAAATVRLVRIIVVVAYGSIL